MRTDKLGSNAAEKFCKMSHQAQINDLLSGNWKIIIKSASAAYCLPLKVKLHVNVIHMFLY